MTNPMIERVAKAIEDAMRAGYVAAISPTSVDDETGEADYSTFRFDGEITPLALASAAIEAMREPTEAVVESLRQRYSIDGDGIASWAFGDDDAAKEIMTIVVDAALKEE